MNNLIKIMFVDDEEKMRGLLHICIDWYTLGFEVVSDASSATQALELIPSEKPDVIITDIEMPFMNGLDFSSIVAEEYPHIKIVILTAHDSFSYAKQGLDMGVVGFLVKPLKREELTRQMMDLKSLWNTEQSRLYEQTLLKKQLEDNREYIAQNYLSNILMSQIPPEKIWENLSYCKIPLHPEAGYYNILLLMPDASLDVEAGFLQHLQCLELLRSCISRISGVILFQDIYQNIIVLSENAKLQLYTYGAHFSSLIKEKLDINVYSGVGSSVKQLEQIHSSYKQAYQNAQMAKFSQNKSFLASNFLEGRNSRLQDIIDRVSEKLNLYLQIPVIEESLALIKEAYIYLDEIPGSTLADIMIFSLSIVNLILTTLSDRGIPYHEIYQTDNLPYKHILSLNDKESMSIYITQLVQFTIGQLDAYTGSKGNTLIRTIQQYINEHLEQSTLTLKKIAEQNYVNPSYLSRTFKEITGMNFMDYLTSMRIEKAKRLMQNHKLRIYEISEAVGVADPNYFSKLFKKHTSLTPAQYKESCLAAKLKEL